MPRQHLIYELRVDLEHLDPPTWRLIDVDADITLRQLHHILQAAFGWETSHMHQFLNGKDIYTDVDGPDIPQIRGAIIHDDRKTKLSAVAREGKSFTYVYDFGDDWRHRITLQEIFTSDFKLGRAVLSDGSGAGASEDSGGPHAYMEMLECIRTGQTDDMMDHSMARMLASGPFDPSFCDQRSINAAFARLAANGGGKK